MLIHPTAIVHPKAKVHPSCLIGPYCVIGAEVELGEDCHLVSHVAIEGPTKIGVDNGFFPFYLDRDGAAGYFVSRVSRLAWRLAITTRFASSSPSTGAPSKAAG